MRDLHVTPHPEPTQREQNAALKSALARRMVEEGWTKEIPPDPDEMNELRASWAGATLREFNRIVGDAEDPPTDLVDLLTDLMHWADRELNVEFADALERARIHYEAETA